MFLTIPFLLATTWQDKAFFTGAEALEYCHKTYDSLGQSFPQTVFYIPGYSNKTDRNSILSIICSDNNLPDCAECHVFVIGYGNHCIYSHQKDGRRTFIYPTSQVRTIVNEYIAQEEKYTKELEDFFNNKNKEAE